MTIDIDLVAMCRQFPCSPEAIALATAATTASKFFAALRQEKLCVDAVQALARFLPKDKAVAWASKSARMAGEQVALTPAEQETLNAVDEWMARPDKARISVVSFAAAELPGDSPAGSVANAAAFSEGIALPEGADAPSFGDNLTGHFTSSAVLLSAAKISPEDTLEPPATPEIPDAWDFPDMAALPEAIGTAPPGIPVGEQAQAAELLEPFLEEGIKLAETVPGWG